MPSTLVLGPQTPGYLGPDLGLHLGCALSLPHPLTWLPVCNSLLYGPPLSPPLCRHLRLLSASLKQLFLTSSRETFCCCSIGLWPNFPYQMPFLLPCFLTSGHKGIQVRQKGSPVLHCFSQGHHEVIHLLRVQGGTLYLAFTSSWGSGQVLEEYVGQEIQC